MFSDSQFTQIGSVLLRESDEISDSPSRISENDELLYKTSTFRKTQNILSSFICSAFILLLVIVALLLFNAFFQIKKNDCSDNYTESSSDSSEDLNFISKKLADELNVDNIRNNLEILAKNTHIAGTREQSQLMHYLAEKYTSYGFSVKIYNYTVLLNYPQISVPNLVELKKYNDEWMTISFGRGTPLGPQQAMDEQQDIRSQQWWNAYSANGSVTGQIVYCNYGTKDDYDVLAQMGVTVRGKIALIRYGALKRNEKVRIAQNMGMTGVLFFSDPIHYTSNNRSNVFPESIYLPGDDAQRGSVLATLGDPLTPLLPSLIYTQRQETEKSARAKSLMPNIPVTPISYNDANKIMELLDGDVVPSFEWKGGLSSVYRLTGEKEFRMTVHSRFVHRTISNVIATLPGSTEPDNWIMVGNHVDAWGNGAIDPISGTATQLEIARVMSSVFSKNPSKRTLVFCHWDAEEYGLIGSTEWIEEMQHILHRRAIAYINVDHIAGNLVPDVKSVPLLYRAIVGAAKKTKQQNLLERSMGRTRLFDSWRYHRGKGPILGDRGVPEIGLPSSGSDYYRFISFLGIPSADLKIEKSPGMSYPLYHSMYETPWTVKTLMDPGFTSFLTLGQFWMELIHRLANSPIIPFDVIDYSTVVSGLVQKVESHINHLNLTQKVSTLNDQFFMLKEALKRFNYITREFHSKITDIQTGSKDADFKLISVINNRLIEIERCFIDWTLGSELNRHVIFSQSRNYHHLAFLASIQDNAKNVHLYGKSEDIKQLGLAISKLQLSIESAIKVLTI